MKRPKKNYAMLILFMFLSLACNQEELFVEDLSQEKVIEETDTTDQENEEDASNEDVEEEPEAIDPTQPCKLSIEALMAEMVDNSISINCFLDLEGKTINMPPNITVNYDGGEIKNGSLVFSGGTIDGELLDISLELKGEVKLSTSGYTLVPSKWDIVEGKTTKEIALQNRENVNLAIELVDRLEGHVFEIGKIDAYFNVEANKVNREYCWKRSIRVPSNFHLKMNDDTFLRVQPTNFPAYSLITTMVTDNAKISGGNLIGDRWEHDYTPIYDVAGVDRSEHGYGHLIWVIGAHDVIIDNVTIKDAIGEGIQVHAETIRDNNGTLKSGTRTSENVIIKNSLITECRRNNIAVVDAKGVTIENCDILDCGQGEQAYDANGNRVFSSAGTAPRYGIDLEALRYANNDGSINEINKIEDVVIRDSRFTGNAAGDIDVYTATNVLIENNYFDKWIASFASSYVTIRNNTFESRDSSFFAIGIKSYVTVLGEELNHHYNINNNLIMNYGTGLWVAGHNQQVKNNTIKNCTTGVLLIADTYDSVFSENSITSELDVSFGYKNLYGCQNINNVLIKNENILVKNRPISFIEFLNNSATDETHIIFENCNFNTNNTNFKLYLKSVANIEFKNNSSNTDFSIIDSKNILLTNNSLNN